MRVYVGTYTRHESQGIYLFPWDSGQGTLGEGELAGEVANPSFLAIHPNRRFLYAVTETDDFQGGRTGAVSSLVIDPGSGRLALLNQQPSGGSGPCYVGVDPTARTVLVANYGSGSVAALPVGDDGRLGPISSTCQHEGHGLLPKRQEGPHAHSIYVDPSGKFALAADLGLDQVRIYRFDAGEATLEAHDPPAACLPAGSGPRHLAFSPDGRFAYVINELNSTLSLFAWDAQRGVLHLRQTVTTLPPGFSGENWPAEVQVHPSGRFVYGSNRGHDSLAIFAVDQATGELTAVGHEPTRGKNPRHFALHPDGASLVVAHQDSNNLVVFAVDAQHGTLSYRQDVQAPTPVCVRFVDV